MKDWNKMSWFVLGGVGAVLSIVILITSSIWLDASIKRANEWSHINGEPFSLDEVTGGIGSVVSIIFSSIGIILSIALVKVYMNNGDISNLWKFLSIIIIAFTILAFTILASSQKLAFSEYKRLKNIHQQALILGYIPQNGGNGNFQNVQNNNFRDRFLDLKTYDINAMRIFPANITFITIGSVASIVAGITIYKTR